MGRQANGCALLTGWFPAEPGPAWEPECDRSALLASVGAARETLEAERSLAPAAVEHLLALPQEARPQEVRAERRYQTWGVAELLLRMGQREAERPELAADLFRLALGAAESLDPAVHIPPLAKDLQARVWAALGEASLSHGDMAEANRALRSACGCLALGSGDLLVEACLLEFEAGIRQSEGRLSEAGALLRQASSRFLEAHQFHDLARVLARRRQLLGDPSRPGRPGLAQAPGEAD